MSIYQGNTKLRAYRGDCRPANVYLGDRKLTGWHEEAVSGTGRAELTDTYNDVTGGKLYGKAELSAPDYMYREYSGSNTEWVYGINRIDASEVMEYDGEESVQYMDVSCAGLENGQIYTLTVTTSAESSIAGIRGLRKSSGADSEIAIIRDFTGKGVISFTVDFDTYERYWLRCYSVKPGRFSEIMLVEGNYTASTIPAYKPYTPPVATPKMLTIDNTIAAPVKGVRVQGRTVYPEDGGAAYSVTNPMVKGCGRNVFSHETYGGQYLVQTEVLEDGRIKTTGLSETTAIGHGTFQLFLGTGDYTMQASCETNTQTAHSLYICKKPDGTGGIVSYTFYGAGAVQAKTFSIEQPGQYYMFLNVGGMTGDESITAVQIIQGSYTADTIPPYEPYKENIITLPYTLRSTEDGAVYDMLDTVTGQLTKRVGENGAALETPVITDITGYDSPRGYDGTTHFTLSDDNSVVDVPFSVIAATKETPIQPDTLNPYSLVCVKNPTLTIRGRNLFDVMDAVEKTPSATYIDGVFSASGDFSYTIPLDPQKTYTVYAEGLEGDVNTTVNKKYSSLHYMAYDEEDKMVATNYVEKKKYKVTFTGAVKLVLDYVFASGGRRFNTRDIMVLEGSYTLDTIPRFEPYITPQTIPITGTLYALKDDEGNDVARDYIDLTEKKIVRGCGYVVRDDLRWSDWSPASSRIHTFTPGAAPAPIGICNMALYSNNASVYKDRIQTHGVNRNLYWYVDATKLGLTRMESRDYANTVLQKFLSRYPVEVVYELETPTEEPIDIPDIPSFYPATVVECTDENGNKVDMELILKQQDE